MKRKCVGVKRKHSWDSQIQLPLLGDGNIEIGIFLELDVHNVFHMIPSHFHQGSQWLYIMFLIGPSNA